MKKETAKAMVMVLIKKLVIINMLVVLGGHNGNIGGVGVVSGGDRVQHGGDGGRIGDVDYGCGERGGFGGGCGAGGCRGGGACGGGCGGGGCGGGGAGGGCGGCGCD